MSNPQSRGKPLCAKLISLSEAQNHRCPYCGCAMRLEHGWPDSATIDHVVPKCRGGNNSPLNLVAACARCNSSRGHQRPDPVSWAIAKEGVKIYAMFMEEQVRENKRKRRQERRKRRQAMRERAAA